MKTKTAPWDYERYEPLITKDALQEMNDLKASIRDAELELMRIDMGEYLRLNGEYFGHPSRAYLADLRNTLESYECSCRPDGAMCSGCKRYFAAKNKNSTAV